MLHREGPVYARTLEEIQKTPPLLDFAGPGDLRQEVWRMEFQGTVQPWAVEFWHAQIAQDEIIVAFLESGECEVAVSGRIHLMAITSEEIGQGFGDTCFVINHQYGLLLHRCDRRGLASLIARLGQWHCSDRDLDMKDRAMPWLTPHGDGAAVAFHNPLT